MRTIQGLLVVTMLASAMAGCAGPPHTFAAEASTPLLIDGGYSYQGQTVRTAGQGSLTVRLDASAQTGLATAHVEERDGTRWRIALDLFDDPAQPGAGIHQNLWMHGDTGNGTAELPRVFAYVAATGRATVERDGQALREPNTLEDRFYAYLLVTRGMVRDVATHQILRADGTCCYNPASPEDGRLATEAGAQAILQVKTKNQATQQPPHQSFYLHLQFNSVTIQRS